MYVRFQKFKLGIQMLKEHNAMEEQHDRQLIVTQFVDKAQVHVKRVLDSLDEFYAKWASEDSDRRQLNEIPDVDRSVNPHWDADHDTRRIHHYVVLKEFLKHLEFSHKFVENVKVNHDGVDHAPQQQRHQQSQNMPKSYMVSSL